MLLADSPYRYARDSHDQYHDIRVLQEGSVVSVKRRPYIQKRKNSRSHADAKKKAKIRNSKYDKRSKKYGLSNILEEEYVTMRR
jgi:hypothetical protein